MKQLSNHTDKSKQTETNISQTTVLADKVCVEVMRFESILSQICSLQRRKLVLVGSFRLQCRGLKFHSFMFSCGI